MKRRKLGVELRHHPGYREYNSAKENAEIGHRDAVRRGVRFPWLEAERQLNYIALLNRRINPKASQKFYSAAAYAKHRHEMEHR